MDDDFDYRDWERRQEDADWTDITSGNDEHRAGALINRALSLGLFEESTLGRVIGFVGAAVEINRKLNRSTQLYQSLKMLGEAYSRKQAWGDCLAAFTEAADVAANELQDDGLRASAMAWRGFAYHQQRNYRASAEAYANAALLNEVINSERAVVDMNLAARSYMLTNDYSKAIDAATKALELASDGYRLSDAVAAHAIISLAYARLVDLPMAKKHWALAKSQGEIAGLERFALHFHTRAEAWIAVLEENYAKADSMFKELALDQRNNGQYNLASNSIFGRALCALRQGDEERAIELMNSIFDVAEQQKLTIDLTEVACEFEDFYASTENWLDALALWRRTAALLETHEFDYAQSELCDARIAYFEAKLAIEPTEKAEKLLALKSRLGDRFFMLYDSIFDLARALAITDRASEALELCDQALAYHEATGPGGLGADHLTAEWHEVRALAYQTLGDVDAAKLEGQLAFELFFDVEHFEQAKRLRDFSKSLNETA